jgi:hypothetical protein
MKVFVLIDQIILEQVPSVWRILWKNGGHFEQNGRHFLCRQKNITSNIFSLGNMKLFVSFFHITAVKLFYCPKCVSEPLLILTERSIMAHIAIILSENNLSDIIKEEIVSKIDQIIFEQVPCLTNFMKKWWPFWTKWSPFLVSTKKHHVQQNVRRNCV